MNTTNRTFIFVAVGAVTFLAAFGVKYINRPIANADFADLGQEFFPDFADPLKATSLSVAKYDPDAKEAVTFSVRQDDQGLWVIPSHHDYPAEAAERLARTAASFIGAKKMALQSRSKDDWGRYGVANPDDDVAVDADAKEGDKDESRGTHVTLRDVGGNPLVDLIIGKAVEGRSQNYYVRQPEKNNIYIAEVNADLSAKFSDWIEPDLLKLNQNDITQVVVDKYSIDEEQGAILKDETLEFDKDATSNKWAVAGFNPEAESVIEAPINDLTKNLDQLKIVGVRPKPEGLNADLTVDADIVNNPVIMQILTADMQRQGFFIARGENGKKKLVSNEGELVAGTKNGVRYTLYFGEVARGSAKDIETGLNETAAAEGDAVKTEPDDQKKADGEDSGDSPPKPEVKLPGEESGPRRYLLVKVEFDESLMGTKPTEPVVPEKPAILNEPAPPADTPEKAGEAKEAAPAEDAAPKVDAAKEESPKEESPKEDAAKEDAALPEETTPDKKDESGCDETLAKESAATEPPTTTESVASDEAAPKSEETPSVEPKADAPKADAPKAEETKSAPAAGDEIPEIIPTKEAPAGSGDKNPAAAADEKTATPDATPENTAPPIDPVAEAKKQYQKDLGKYETDKLGFVDAVKSWDERSEEGQKVAKELSTRFGAWYYVISADSFEKLRPSRMDVVGPKEAAKLGDAQTPPQFDLPGGGIPGFGAPGQ